MAGLVPAPSWYEVIQAGDLLVVEADAEERQFLVVAAGVILHLLGWFDWHRFLRREKNTPPERAFSFGMDIRPCNGRDEEILIFSV